MDCYIDMYVNHKALLQFNDNFHHFVSHSGVDRKKLKGFNASLLSADTRFIKMYEKAKELNCDYIATGHYAKMEYSEKYGRYVYCRNFC